MKNDEQICDEVAEHLRALGLKDAYANHTGGGIFCVFIPVENAQEWIFGMADVVWGGDLLDADTHEQADPEQSVTTTMSSESDDTKAIAEAIAQALWTGESK